MKMILKKMSFFYSLKNAEHFDLFESFYEEIVPHVDRIPGFASEWGVFASCFKMEDDFYKSNLKLGETDEIQAAHVRRNELFIRLKRGVGFKSLSDTLEEREAADRLLFILRNYRKANVSAYTEESALLTNVIDDLRKPDAAACVDVLGFSPLIGMLERSNEAFKVLYRRRSVKFHMVHQVLLSDIRKKCDAAFGEIADTVNSFYRVSVILKRDEGLTSLLGTLIDTLNSYIEQAERVYSRRVPGYRLVKGAEDGVADVSASGAKGIPRLGMGDFVSYADSPLPEPFMGDHWRMKADDPEVFSAVLYPDALNGVLFYPEVQASAEFPVDGFIMSADRSKAVGLTVSRPSERTFYTVPFRGTDKGSPVIVKNGITLAILDHVPYPAILFLY